MMKNMAASSFGYDISEHEALKKGIVHEASAQMSWALAKMMLSVSMVLYPEMRNWLWPFAM